MLEITIPAGELFDSETNSFRTLGKDTTIQLEHSLLSISKWESRWHKSFMTDGWSARKLSADEFISYVKDMTITKNVNPDVYFNLTAENQREISAYINDPMTATTFSNMNAHGSKQVITAEIIYWEMIQFNIPFECQKWHLNRLMTLIRVCSIKQGKPEKVPYKEMVAQRNALNAQRKAARRSRG